MAIDSYAKLQAEIQDTLDRDDLVADVTAFSPSTIEGVVKRAIRKCEIRVQRQLRVRDMETSTTLTLSAGTSQYSLPSDFLSMRTFYINKDPIRILRQDSFTNILSEHPNTATREPDAFAIVGSSIYIRPVPDSAYSCPMHYYRTIPALSDSNTSNWLLTDAPDVYLYGSCLEITPYLGEDQRIGVWKAAFDAAITDIVDDDAITKYDGVLVSSVLPGMNIV